MSAPAFGNRRLKRTHKGFQVPEPLRGRTATSIFFLPGMAAMLIDEPWNWRRRLRKSSTRSRLGTVSKEVQLQADDPRADRSGNPKLATFLSTRSDRSALRRRAPAAAREPRDRDQTIFPQRKARSGAGRKHKGPACAARRTCRRILVFRFLDEFGQISVQGRGKGPDRR
jgi:hypothetical protein